MSDLDLAIKIALEMGASQTELNKLKVLLTELSKMTPDPKVRAQIDSVLQGIKLLDGAIEKVTEDSKKAGRGLDDVASRARAENLKEVAGSISTLSDALLSVGKGIIQTTADFEMLEARMLTAAKGNEKLRDELMAFAKEAASATPYSVQQVTDSIIKLEAYGFKAKEVFSKVGDMAAAYGKDLSQAVEAVADAQTGELERLKEFTITKQQLIDKAREMFNKEIVNSKGQITDLQAMNEALFAIMEERSSGAMGRMMDTYTGAMSNFKDAVEQMQQSLGKEVIPKLTDFVKWAGSVVSAFNSLDEGTKSVLSNLGLFTIAIGGIGGKLVTTIIQIQAFTASLEASQIAMLGFAGVAAGIGIVVGVLANSYIDAWRKMEEQKSEKIEEECKKIAEGLKTIKEHMDAIKSKSPLEIAVKMSEKEINTSIQGLIEKIKTTIESELTETEAPNIWNWITGNNQKPSDLAGEYITYNVTKKHKVITETPIEGQYGNKTHGESIAPEPGTMSTGAGAGFSTVESQTYKTEKEITSQIAQTQTLSEAYQESMGFLSEYLKKKQEGTQITAEETQQAKEYAKVLDEIRERIEKTNPRKAEEIKLDLEKIGILKEANEYQKKFLSGKFDDTPTMGPIRQEISTTDLKKKIQYYKDDLNHLRSYFSEYKLTYEQQITLKEAINKRKDELNKEEERNDKEHWNTYINDLKVSLSTGEISQKQYNDSIASYLNQNTTELQNNADLKIKIEKEYYSGVNKLQKEQAVETKKAEKDRIESIKAAWSTFIDEQTVKLNEGIISQKEYMTSIKKYQQENMRDIQKVSGLSLDIEKKYSQEVKKLRQEEAVEAKKAAEAKLKAEEEIALEIEALDNDVTGSQLKNIQKKIDKFKDAGVEQVKIEEYTQKAIQDLQQSTQEKFDQQIQNQKDKIEDLAEKIRQIDVKLKENKEKQDKLTSLSSSGGDNSSPIKSIEEAFSTGLGEFTKKMEELKKLEEESQKLQAEKAQAEREQKQAQEKLVKAQDDSKKATEELTAALKENTATLGNQKKEDTPEEDKEPAPSDTPENPETPPSTNDTPTQGQGGNNPGSSTQGQGGNLPNNSSSSAPTGTIVSSDGRSFAPGTSRTDQGWIRKPEGTVTLSDGRSAAPSTAIVVMPDSRATSSQKTNMTSTSGNQYGNYTGPTNITNVTNINLNSQKFAASGDISASAGQLLSRISRYDTPA